mmetsp:Transcript_22193/g.64442  ORF Transcript_22193/g.64442 Transcript_22193/m.64442 type:complete len:339 (-) Transcript_22193:494-1510(-)
MATTRWPWESGTLATRRRTSPSPGVSTTSSASPTLGTWAAPMGRTARPGTTTTALRRRSASDVRPGGGTRPCARGRKRGTRQCLCWRVTVLSSSQPTCQHSPTDLTAPQRSSSLCTEERQNKTTAPCLLLPQRRAHSFSTTPCLTCTHRRLSCRSSSQRRRPTALMVRRSENWTTRCIGFGRPLNMLESSRTTARRTVLQAHWSSSPATTAPGTSSATGGDGGKSVTLAARSSPLVETRAPSSVPGSDLRGVAAAVIRGSSRSSREDTECPPSPGGPASSFLALSYHGRLHISICCQLCSPPRRPLSLRTGPTTASTSSHTLAAPPESATRHAGPSST